MSRRLLRRSGDSQWRRWHSHADIDCHLQAVPLVALVYPLYSSLRQITIRQQDKAVLCLQEYANLIAEDVLQCTHILSRLNFRF